MIYPNYLNIGFCDWLLNSSYNHWSVVRIELITLISDAAIAGTSVSQNDWNNFTRVFSPFWSAYSAQINLSSNMIFSNTAYSFFLCS